MKFFARGLCFLFLSTILFSCGKSTKELVTGRWKIEDITAPEPDLSQMSDQEREYYKQQIEQQQNSLLTTGFYEFNAGGQGIFELEGKRMEGKWRLSEDEKKLLMKEKNGISETVFSIKELSETVLVIEFTENNQVTRLVMKKQVINS